MKTITVIIIVNVTVIITIFLLLYLHYNFSSFNCCLYSDFCSYIHFSYPSTYETRTYTRTSIYFKLSNIKFRNLKFEIRNLKFVIFKNLNNDFQAFSVSTDNTHIDIICHFISIFRFHF